MADRTDTFFAAEGAIHGYGAQFEVGNGASPTESFQAVAAVRRITFGAMATEDIDRTHLRSPDAHREHMPGLRDSAAIQMEGIWLPRDESQSIAGGGAGSFTGGGMADMWKNRTTHNFKIVLYSDGSPSVDLPVRGYVSQWQPGEIGPDGLIPVSFSVQPTEDYSADLP